MTPEALAPLRRAIASYDLELVLEVETSVGQGCFTARGWADAARLPALSRSWEAFDRVYRALDVDEEQALLTQHLWPALRHTALRELPPEATLDLAFTLPGECVGIWPGEQWTDLIRRFDRAIRAERNR